MKKAAPVDWRKLAEDLGTIRSINGGWRERGGTDVGCDAIAHILGDQLMVEAADFYVGGGPGAELALSVLRLLQPPAAMEQCRKIFATSKDGQERSDALYLLSQICDRRVLEWIPQFFADSDPGPRVWSMTILDQLLIMQQTISEFEARPHIEAALGDDDERVRHAAEQLQESIEHEKQRPADSAEPA